MCYPLPVIKKPPSSCSSPPFECVHPSRPLKADRPHCSHCHRSSRAMNISGAQTHTKNVEKFLACVPSEQNRPPSHVAAEGVRNTYGRSIKASSLATATAFRNKSHPDKTQRVREGVCWEYYPARRSNETNTQIRREQNIKQNGGAQWSNWEWMLDVYWKKLAEWNMYVGMRVPACSRLLINAVVHQCERTPWTDPLLFSPTVSGPAGDTEGAAHPCAQLHLQSGLLREILSRW